MANQSVVVTGMVLSAAPMGDFDKRVVLLTKEKGKISAFAKGARRQNSSLLAATTPFSFGEFELYEGRTSYNIMHANMNNYFMELKQDLEKVSYASYFAEFAAYYTREYGDEVLMLKLLYQTMRALESDKIKAELIRYIYELKVLMVNGEYPEVFECAFCGSKEHLNHFDFSKRGIICDECVGKAPGAKRILPSLLYTMQYIIASDIQKLYTFTVSDEVLQQLKEIMNRYIRENVDRNFKSLEFLDGIVD